MKRYNVAVVGATGNTGHTVLSVLAEREFPVNKVFAIASRESKGKSVSYGDDDVLKICSIDEVDFSEVDICFMCAGSAISRQYAEKITSSGCCLIDKTSHFRMFPDVPLIVPEVNFADLANGAPLGIISNPNCVAIPLSMILDKISQVSAIKRAVVSTYQSVSGAGKSAVDELYSQTKGAFFGQGSESRVFRKVIAFNAIPQIGDKLANGWTDEEVKIKNEVFKISGGKVNPAVTCVRVPVFIGHGISVSCELSDEFDISEIVDILSESDGIRVLDRDENVATPVDAQGEDDVFVSRIRVDDTVENGLMFWIVADNLRKGAALNGVQIAEMMLEMDSTLNMFKKVSARN